MPQRARQLYLPNNYFPLGQPNGKGSAADFTLKVPSVMGAITKEPTGIPLSDNTYTLMTFTNSTRTFSIAPVGDSFDVWVQGTKFTFTTAQTLVIPNTEGTFYLYFDTAGTLQVMNTFSTALITDYAFVSSGYWDATLAKNLLPLNERHGLEMDGITHALFHSFLGSEYKTGFALSAFSLGTGSSNSDVSFQVDSGTWSDEDINFSYTATTQFTVVYRSGASLWKTKDANAYPLIESGATTLNGAGGSTAVYTGANGRPAYNKNTSGTWSLTETSEGAYILVHLAVINDESKKIVAFLGTNEYYTEFSALNNISVEINELKSSVPLNEYIFVGTILLECSSSFANTPKARIIPIPNAVSTNYIDLRPTNPKSLLSFQNIFGLLDQWKINQSPVYFEKYLDTDFVAVSISATANVSLFQTTNSGVGAAFSFLTANNTDTILRATTGTGASGTSWYKTNNGIIFTTGLNYELVLEFDFKLSAVSSGTQRYTIRLGLSGTNFVADPNDGIFLRYSDNLGSGNLILASRAGGVESTLSSAIAGSTSKVKVKVVIYNGTDIYLYIDNTKVAGGITTNIPVNTTLFIGAGIVKSIGTTAVTMGSDYFQAYKHNYTGR